jgi:MinD-like ATPase involved in chromosome partitioning or flagellar assembly
VIGGANKSGRKLFDWEAAGHELGESLNAHHAIVVVGIDPMTTGRVAIGIARAQAFKRRVAVGDLFAESPPIHELVHTNDPHGLVDSFLYGVSLSKIAYEVPGAGQLFVMPSGTEPPEYEEIFPNPRWHRLTAGFREVGALLVLAAPASAPRLEDLVAATDGAILVGEAVPRKLPVAAVLASIREPKPDVPATQPQPRDDKPASTPTPVEMPWWKKRQTAIAGVIIALALAAIVGWLAYRPLAGEKARIGRRPDSTKVATNVIVQGLDSSRHDSTSADSIGGAPLTIPVVSNPADSSQAAAYGIEIVADYTQAGAIMRLQRDSKMLPAATYAPVLIQGARWFKAIAGAANTRTAADSLLANLARDKKLADGGRIARLPYAFLIDTVRPAAVPEVVADYVSKGQPVYALLQPNGWAWVLAGAFESPEQSSLYAETLRSTRKEPVVLVYRKGRMF